MNSRTPVIRKEYNMPENSRRADKFVVRLPDGMREDVAELARLNKRSMNSEIIAAMANQINGVAEARRYWIPTKGQLVMFDDKPYHLNDFDFVDGELVGCVKALHPLPQDPTPGHTAPPFYPQFTVSLAALTPVLL